MPFALRHTALSLRPIRPADKDLLCAIYSSTRTEEMQRLPHWSEAQKAAFLRMQFEAQHEWYGKNYPGAHFWMVLHRNAPIGRLYLHTAYTPDGMRIIDVALLPEWRGQGIGSGILSDVIAFAEGENKSVTIHVESFNPAKRLYQKLGFRFVSATNGVYHLMERKVPQTVSL